MVRWFVEQILQNQAVGLWYSYVLYDEVERRNRQRPNGYYWYKRFHLSHRQVPLPLLRCGDGFGLFCCLLCQKKFEIESTIKNLAVSLLFSILPLIKLQNTLGAETNKCGKETNGFQSISTYLFFIFLIFTNKKARPCYMRTSWTADEGRIFLRWVPLEYFGQRLFRQIIEYFLATLEVGHFWQEIVN